VRDSIPNGEGMNFKQSMKNVNNVNVFCFLDNLVTEHKTGRPLLPVNGTEV
jgi:hypothetical protein